METVRASLSFLFSLLILVTVPAVHTLAAQCLVDLPVISTADHASAGDQCHFRGAPDKQPFAPRAAAARFPIAAPAIHEIDVYTPQINEGATHVRVDTAIDGKLPVLMRTETLLI